MTYDAKIEQTKSQGTDLNVDSKRGFEWKNNMVRDWDLLIKKPNKIICHIIYCTGRRRHQTYTTYECLALRRP